MFISVPTGTLCFVLVHVPQRVNVDMSYPLKCVWLILCYGNKRMLKICVCGVLKRQMEA